MTSQSTGPIKSLRRTLSRDSPQPLQTYHLTSVGSSRSRINDEDRKLTPNITMFSPWTSNKYSENRYRYHYTCHSGQIIQEFYDLFARTPPKTDSNASGLRPDMHPHPFNGQGSASDRLGLGQRASLKFTQTVTWKDTVSAEVCQLQP